MFLFSWSVFNVMRMENIPAERMYKSSVHIYPEAVSTDAPAYAPGEKCELHYRIMRARVNGHARYKVFARHCNIISDAGKSAQLISASNYVKHVDTCRDRAAADSNTFHDKNIVFSYVSHSLSRCFGILPYYLNL